MHVRRRMVVLKLPFKEGHKRNSLSHKRAQTNDMKHIKLPKVGRGLSSQTSVEPHKYECFPAYIRTHSSVIWLMSIKTSTIQHKVQPTSSNSSHHYSADFLFLTTFQNIVGLNKLVGLLLPFTGQAEYTSLAGRASWLTRCFFPKTSGGPWLTACSGTSGRQNSRLPLWVMLMGLAATHQCNLRLVPPAEVDARLDQLLNAQYRKRPL